MNILATPQHLPIPKVCSSQSEPEIAHLKQTTGAAHAGNQAAVE